MPIQACVPLLAPVCSIDRQSIARLDRFGNFRYKKAVQICQIIENPL